MSIKWLGAVLIMTGCGGVGFSMAMGVRQQETLLRQLIHVLGVLETELQYRLTELPDLCKLATRECNGILRRYFQNMHFALTHHDHSDAAGCSDYALNCCDPGNSRIRKHLQHLGRSLGRFDLPGQLQGLQTVRRVCESDLEVLRQKRDIRLRSYQTLSLCAGAALAILLA